MSLAPLTTYIYSRCHNGELIKTLSRIFSSWWIKGGRWFSLIKMKDHRRPWPCIGRWLICTRRGTSDLWRDVEPPLTSSDRVPSGRFYYLDFRSFFNIKIPFSPWLLAENCDARRKNKTFSDKNACWNAIFWGGSGSPRRDYRTKGTAVSTEETVTHKKFK